LPVSTQKKALAISQQSALNPGHYSSGKEFWATCYWSSDRLWGFIGVPFEVVTVAIQRVAKEFRKSLIDGLRDLLP
jgi:hypothetical protein